MKKFTLALLLSAWPLLAAADADPEAGKALTAVCGACHGPDGNSPMSAFPKIAGQNEKYLLKQLKDIKSGARSVPTMAGQLDAMSDQDLENVAAYYASQTSTKGTAQEDLVALGESIYRAGVADKGVAACTACHSPTGKGNGPAGYPALSGQWADYTALSLRALRTEERDNDGDSKMMRDVAYRLSDKEIDAVSSYIQGLR